jgi:phosphatidylinositol alpha-1,6-mannosyltransferase
VKIVIPTADYPPIEGGISTVCLQLARTLSKLGHTVTVVAPHFEGMDSFDRSEPYRVERFRGYGLGWLRVFPMLWQTWPHTSDADLLVSINVASGGVIGWVVKRLRGVRYVTLAYAYEFLKFARHSPPAPVLRMIYRNSIATIAISQFTHDALVEFGVPAERIAVVLPGAEWPVRATKASPQDLREKLGIRAIFIILAVGRFIPRKGHEALIEAMPRILMTHPETQLVLVGRGPRFEPACERASRLGLGDRIIFAGHISDDDLYALYDLCDLFALPTGKDTHGHVEGFGLVFAEAAARGKPVVAGRSGGVIDAVIDDETGFLVKPGDVEETAGAIIRLLNDKALAERMGRAGRDRVARELNWDVFTQRILEEVDRCGA